MNGTAKHIRLNINKTELNVINEITESKTDYFYIENINEKAYKLTFESINKVIEIDKLIKEKLNNKGFDIDYNPPVFGRICEGLIDKFYQILK